MALGNPDYSQVDQQSFLAGVKSVYDTLQAQQEQANQYGVNPQIIQGQRSSQLADLDASRSILAQPNPNDAMPVQNWYYNPDNPQANKAQQLIANGPMIPQGQPGLRGAMQPPNPAQIQTAQRDWQRQIDNANFWARSSFYGGGNTQMTPEEYQKAVNAGELTRLGQARSLVQGLQKEEPVDRGLLSQMSTQSGAILQGSQASRNQQIQSDAALNAEAIRARSGENVANIKGQYDVATKEAEYNGTKTKLTKAVQGQLQQSISDSQSIQGNLNGLAQRFDPNFFTYWGRGYKSLSEGLSKAGLASDAQKSTLSNYTETQQQMEQIFNQYRKSITGAAASVQELDRLRASIFNTDLDPESAKASLVDLMSEMQIKSWLAQKALQQGLDTGNPVEAGTEKFGKLVDNLYQSNMTNEAKDQIKATIIQMNPQLAYGRFRAADIVPPQISRDEALQEIARRKQAQPLVNPQDPNIGKNPYGR